MIVFENLIDYYALEDSPVEFSRVGFMD